MGRRLACGMVATALLSACSSSPPPPPDPDRAAALTSPAHRVQATNGDDVLVGGPGPDVIDGRRGSDVIRGRAGDDELLDPSGVGTGRPLDTSRDAFHGGPGDDLIHASHRDRVHAGPGDDRILANYLERGDVVDCGPGRDVVVLNDDDPGIAQTGCETVRVQYAG